MTVPAGHLGLCKISARLAPIAEARRPAGSRPDETLVPVAEQDYPQVGTPGRAFRATHKDAGRRLRRSVVTRHSSAFEAADIPILARLAVRAVVRLEVRVELGTKCNPHDEAAFGPGLHREVGLVGAGDSSHDGEAEAVSVFVAGSLVANLLERFEEPTDLAIWDDWPGVCDPDERVPATHPGSQEDFTVVKVVADSVVEQVRDQPLGETRIADGGSGKDFGLEAQPLLLGVVERTLGEDLAGYLGQIEGFPLLQTTFAAGQGKERVDEPLLADA